MTLMLLPTAWAMPVACSEARSDGQARPARSLQAQVFRVSIPCPRAPRFCLTHCGSNRLPFATTPTPASHLYLRPHWPDAVAPEDPAELQEGSAPKGEVGVHAGPSPPGPPHFPGQRGPKVIIRSK